MGLVHEYNPLTGEVLKYNSTDTIVLQDAISHKIAELTYIYRSIISTFQSSATGTTYTYIADDNSMGKFNAEYTFINGASYDGSSINWLTVESGGVVHTKAQFNQVWLDGRNYVASQFNHYDSLVKKVQACIDVASVQAITW